MSISIQNEQHVLLSEVPDLPCLPRCRGKTGRLHPSTVWRWALKGVRGVRLEVTRVGGTLCTSAEGLQRFFDRLADGPSLVEAPPTKPVAPDQADIERQLDGLGVRVDGRRWAVGSQPPACGL